METLSIVFLSGRELPGGVSENMAGKQARHPLPPAREVFIQRFLE